MQAGPHDVTRSRKNVAEGFAERRDVAAAECTASCAGVVVDCDVAEGIPTIAAQRDGTQALVLVRVFGEPIGMLSEKLSAQGLEPHELAAAIVRELGPELRERIEECGLDFTGELPTDGLRPPRVPRFLESRARVLRDGPHMTVAVCTRDRPEGLEVLLDSLNAQEYTRFRVLVVDNAPSDDRTRRLVAELARERRHRLRDGATPGLSWARNRAIEASDDEIIAWADDDAVCDRWWAAELARGFVEIPDAGAVTGIVSQASSRRRARYGSSSTAAFAGAVASLVPCSRRRPRTCRARCIRCRRSAPATTWRSGAKRSSGSAASTARSAPGRSRRRARTQRR